MELDAFKEQLNRQMAANARRSDADIAALLGNRTRSVIQRLRRNLRFELGLTLTFTLISAAVVFFTGDGIYRDFFTGAGVFSVFVAIALFGLLRKLAPEGHRPMPVKQHIAHVILVVTRYQRIYLWLGMALLPLCFIAVLWLGFRQPEGVLKPVPANILAWLSGILVVFGVASFFFTRWYLRRMYGNYLRQLTQVMSEMEEES